MRLTMPKIIRDDRARQGPFGRPGLGVLLGGLALAAIAAAGLMIWIGATSPDSATQDASRQAVTGSQEGSSNANPTDRISPANPAYPAPANPTATGTTNQ